MAKLTLLQDEGVCMPSCIRASTSSERDFPQYSRTHAEAMMRAPTNRETFTSRLVLWTIRSCYTSIVVLILSRDVRRKWYR